MTVKRHSNEGRLHIKNRSITRCSPHVYVTYSNPNDFKAGADRGPQFNPFGPDMMAFTSLEDLMKNLPKAMANIGKAMRGFPTDSPTFTLHMK